MINRRLDRTWRSRLGVGVRLGMWSAVPSALLAPSPPETHSNEGESC